MKWISEQKNDPPSGAAGDAKTDAARHISPISLSEIRDEGEHGHYQTQKRHETGDDRNDNHRSRNE